MSDCLWDITSVKYLKRKTKKNCFTWLLDELKPVRLPAKEDTLKKKIKILCDTYYNELNKIKNLTRVVPGRKLYTNQSYLNGCMPDY